MNAIRAETPPGPPTHRARGCRSGVKQRTRAALRSDHVTPVSKPSVPERAPAIPEPQRAAGVATGKLRAAVRRVRAVEKANRELTAARASDRAELLRLREQTTATASDQDARLRYLTKAAFDQDARLLALELANRELTKTIASDQAELLRLRELTKTFAADRRPQDAQPRLAAAASTATTLPASPTLQAPSNRRRLDMGNGTGYPSSQLLGLKLRPASGCDSDAYWLGHVV